jgi:hypothetical protein
VPIDSPDPGEANLGKDGSSESPTAGVSKASLGRDEFERARDYIYKEMSWTAVTAVDRESQLWRSMNSLQNSFNQAMRDSDD